METKQSAVDYLEQEFKKFLNWQSFSFSYKNRTQGDISSVAMYEAEDFMRAIEKAREMENEQTGYTKEDVLKAGEIGEINHYDYKHIVSLLDEARAINRQNKQLI